MKFFLQILLLLTPFFVSAQQAAPATEDRVIEKKILNFSYARTNFAYQGTDGRAYIQDLIDSTPDSSTVVIPPGYYEVNSNLIVLGRTSLKIDFSEVYMTMTGINNSPKNYGTMLAIINSSHIEIINGHWDVNEAFASNGISAAGVSYVTVDGAFIENAVWDPAELGGRAVTFQQGANHCVGRNVISLNCDIGFNAGGDNNLPVYDVLYQNCTAIGGRYNGVESNQGFTPAGEDFSVARSTFDNIRIINCGWDNAPIALDRSHETTFSNITIVNDTTTVNSVIRGTGYELTFSNINFYTDTLKSVVDAEKWPAPFAAGAVTRSRGWIGDITVHNAYDDYVGNPTITADLSTRLQYSHFNVNIARSDESRVFTDQVNTSGATVMMGTQFITPERPVVKHFGEVDYSDAIVTGLSAFPSADYLIYVDRPAALSAITVANGFESGFVYIYLNSTSGAIEGIQL